MYTFSDYQVDFLKPIIQRHIYIGLRIFGLNSKTLCVILYFPSCFELPTAFAKNKTC